jgi:hypothetical protein
MKWPTRPGGAAMVPIVLLKEPPRSIVRMLAAYVRRTSHAHSFTQIDAPGFVVQIFQAYCYVVWRLI